MWEVKEREDKDFCWFAGSAQDLILALALAQESLLVESGETYGVPGTEPRLAAYKARVLPTILLLYPKDKDVKCIGLVNSSLCEKGRSTTC